MQLIVLVIRFDLLSSCKLVPPNWVNLNADYFTGMVVLQLEIYRVTNYSWWLVEKGKAAQWQVVVGGI